MHEMSVTQALLDMVLEKTPPGNRVTDIYLQVGEISHVIPDTVAIYFKHLSHHGPAANAQIHFETIPLQLSCRQCKRAIRFPRQVETERAPQILRRAFATGCQCGSKNLEISAGMGCELVRIEVDQSTIT